MREFVFSIIIPTYNSAATLGAALDSIVGQTFRNYEVIVVDGLSKDGTAALVDRYASGNPAIRWVSEKDNGIYDAMNKGIGLARGEWLYFLGSDDSLLDEKVLENVYAATRNTDAPFLYGNILVQGNNLWGRDGMLYDGEFDIKKVVNHNINHQAIFYHSSVFETVGLYNIEYTTCADWDVNLRCFARFRTQYVPLTIARFQAGGESTQREHDPFLRRDSVLRLKEYFHIGYFNPLFAGRSWQLWNVANDHLTEKRYARSFAFFIYAWYHSAKKKALLRNYLINLYTSLKRTSQK